MAARCSNCNKFTSNDEPEVSESGTTVEREVTLDVSLEEYVQASHMDEC